MLLYTEDDKKYIKQKPKKQKNKKKKKKGLIWCLSICDLNCPILKPQIDWYSNDIEWMIIIGDSVIFVVWKNILLWMIVLTDDYQLIN